MSSNAQLVTVLCALVLIAIGVRVVCGPWQGPAAMHSMYAAAKLGPQANPFGIEVELAVGGAPARLAVN